MQCETVLLDQLAQITVDVFASMLQLEISPAEPATFATSEIAAFIRIQGAWNGAILLQCSLAQASDWACRLLRVDRQTVDHESMEDALGEIVNMIGGNWKALLPPRNVLSVPTVLSHMHAAQFASGSEPESCLTFSSEQGTFNFCLFESTVSFHGEQQSEKQEQVYV